MRDTSNLRVKNLTRPAAQVLEWRRAHTVAIHTVLLVKYNIE